MDASEAPTARPGLRVFISVLSGVSSSLIIALFGIMAVRIMTRHLGPTNYGLVVTAITFVTLATILTDLGVNSVTGREIAKNPDDAANILGHNLGLRLTLSLALIIPVVLVGFYIYRDRPSQLHWAIAIIAIGIPFDSIRSVTSGFFVATIRNYITAAIAIINQIVYVAILIIAFRLHAGIMGCAYAYMLSTVIASATAITITCREVKLRPIFRGREWISIVRQSITIGAIQIVNLVYLKADSLLLSILTTPHAVGLYGIAYLIIGFMSMGPGFLMVSLMPLIARAEDTEVESLVRRAVGWLAAAGALVSCGTFLFAPAVVQLLAGPKFTGAILPVRVLGISCTFTYVNNAYGDRKSTRLNSSHLGI